MSLVGILAAAPALPLDEAGKYVAAAYIFFLAIVLIYVGIMAAKLVRMERDLTSLNDALDAREGRERAAAEAAPPESGDGVAAGTGAEDRR